MTGSLRVHGYGLMVLLCLTPIGRKVFSGMFCFVVIFLLYR